MDMTQNKPKIMTLTDAAAARIRQIMSESEKPVAGVRIGVKNAGCVGMEYTLDFVETPDLADDVVEDNGAKLFVDPTAILFLLGTKMDYQVDKLSAGFVFENPNQTDACGCGLSVAISPADEAQLNAFEKPVNVS
jgi:iron-sulfur cluster assembly protein